MPLVLACSSSDGSTSEALEGCRLLGTYQVTSTPQASDNSCMDTADTDILTIDVNDGDDGAVIFAGLQGRCGGVTRTCGIDAACSADLLDPMTGAKIGYMTVTAALTVDGDRVTGIVNASYKTAAKSCSVTYDVSGTRK